VELEASGAPNREELADRFATQVLERILVARIELKPLFCSQEPEHWAKELRRHTVQDRELELASSFLAILAEYDTPHWQDL
jgi:hypothetical protein